MKIIPILLIALLVLGSYSTFNYAYAIDNNCMINPIHIIQMPIPLGCIEQRLDALENATPSGETTICTNAGGTSWFQSSSGGNCVFNGQTVTAPIVLTQNANDLNISCPTCITTAPLWEKLCTNTLVSAATTLSCSSFAARKNLYFAIEYKNDATPTNNRPSLQFNSDTATNYTWRTSLNGAADTTGIS